LSIVNDVNRNIQPMVINDLDWDITHEGGSSG
jgi:hypothetical protein